MHEGLIDDDFWALIEPLIATRSLPKRRSAGRPRAPDRAVFSGIVFVLRSGISWTLLPKKLGYGTSQVCCRRLVNSATEPAKFAAGDWSSGRRKECGQVFKACSWMNCSVAAMLMRQMRLWTVCQFVPCCRETNLQ